MKSISAKALSSNLRKYLRAAGYFQKDLADELGLHTKVLSLKLSGNGNVHLTEEEVRRIITTLARWQAITTQNEALHLLDLAQKERSSFSPQEWRTHPLNLLASRNTMHHTHTDYDSPRSVRHNLPAQFTRLVGREDEVERLRHMLGQEVEDTASFLAIGDNAQH